MSFRKEFRVDLSVQVGVHGCEVGFELETGSKDSVRFVVENMATREVLEGGDAERLLGRERVIDDDRGAFLLEARLLHIRLRENHVP